MRRGGFEAFGTTKQTSDDPLSNGYILVHNADVVLRERVRMRQKAILDYGNDMAYAKRIGREEGRAEGRAEGREERNREVTENMRKSGFTDEQIRMALGTF